MLLITKELAEAVLKSHTSRDGTVLYFSHYRSCDHCHAHAREAEWIEHEDNCIVKRAKLLLEQEWPNERH